MSPTRPLPTVPISSSQSPDGGCSASAQTEVTSFVQKPQVWGSSARTRVRGCRALNPCSECQSGVRCPGRNEGGMHCKVKTRGSHSSLTPGRLFCLLNPRFLICLARSADHSLHGRRERAVGGHSVTRSLGRLDLDGMWGGSVVLHSAVSQGLPFLPSLPGADGSDWLKSGTESMISWLP